MTLGKPTGNQIAFFILAVWLLVVPLTQFIIRTGGLVGLERDVFERYFHGVLVLLTLLLVPPLRRASVSALRTPIPRWHFREVAIVSAVSPLHTFAFAGAYALWFATAEGPLSLQQRLSGLDSAAHAMAYATDPLVFATHFLIAVGLGPVMEEILFRAFLFRAWQSRYGFIPALLLTATLFGALHANFFGAFLGSILFTCVYKRTGSLWSAIIVHATTNALCYYPLLGRFVFPRDLEYPGDLATWSGHIAIFFVFTTALAIYVWMARDRSVASIEGEELHVALPR